jgi:hypothetical protein
MVRTVFLASLVFFSAGCSQDSALNSIDEHYITPAIRVVGPEAGEWLPATSVVVHGTTVGLTDVLVNDFPAVTDGDKFESSIGLDRGINRVEVKGTDGRGDTKYARYSVIAGDFADPSKTIEEALHLRLNQGGLDAVCEIINDAIDPEEISDSIEGTPVYEAQYGLFSWNAVEVTAILMGLSFDRLNTELDPGDDRLYLSVEIPDLDTWLWAYGDVFGLDFEVDAFVWADSVVVEGEVTIDTNEGELVVEFENPNVSLYGFGYDTSLIPYGIETLVFVDEVRGFLEDMLVDIIAEKIPEILDEQLAGLDLSFETEMLGQDLKVEAAFADANIDRDGLALTVDVVVDMGSEDLHEAPGFLTAPEATVELSTKSDVAFGLSDNLFNRVLHGVWQSGLLDLSLSTDDESLDKAVALMLKADSASIQIEAPLPPVMVERDGQLNIELGELLVTIDTPNGDFGDHLEVAISGAIPLNLVGQDGELLLEFGDADLMFMVRDSDWGAASNEAVTNLLAQILNPQLLLAGMGALSFPLPTLTDNLAIKSLKVDTEDNEYCTAIRINLER